MEVPIILNAEQFGRFFVDLRSSATRVETLDRYVVAEERENLALYLSGAPLPPGRNQEWADVTRRHVANGRYLGRVHVISHTLTPYLRFEIDWYYAVNGGAGEDIRFTFREDVADLTCVDTWIFDERTVLDLNYDDEGRLLCVNHDVDPVRLDRALATWRELHRRSFPLADLLAMVRGGDLTISP